MSGPDPGGIFASDAHRRTQGVIPAPDADSLSEDGVVARVDNDDYNDLDADEVNEVLQDLEASGYVTQADGSWAATERGYDLLTGPPAEERDDL
jgi:CRP-like cAMP-binding protein